MNKNTSKHKLHWLLSGISLALIVIITNVGFFHRVATLLSSERFTTLAIYLSIWTIAVVAVFAVALQPNRIVRVVWGVLISLSAAASFFYYSISQNELTVFDVVSLWSARHETSRALDEYSSMAAISGILFLISVFVFVSFPRRSASAWGRWTLAACCLPIVPIALIAGITYLKDGGGSQAMPKQFATLSIATVAAANLATQDVPTRRNVETTPAEPPKIKHVVMLIDESIRPDYIDWTPDNPYTPFLASVRQQIANFGAAGSGSNCSHYSNAILRFGGNRADLINSVQRNPTIWQYAKQAGFRTVYIDGQASMVKNNPGFFQNFMTVTEASYIDELIRIKDTSLEEVDFKLLDAIKDQLSKDEPTFIYANKNGAHFPYDTGYPASEAVFLPTYGASAVAPEDREDDASNTPARINSYRNVIRWSVDLFFEKFFEDIDLSEVAVLYTSDHGQGLTPDHLKHCTTINPDPRQGLVPVLAFTGDQDLQKRFLDASRTNFNAATHFALTSTALDLFGYPKEHVAANIGSSLFDELNEPVKFTSGDIFGLFSSKLHWTLLDTSQNFLEPDAFPEPSASFQSAKSH